MNAELSSNDSATRCAASRSGWRSKLWGVLHWMGWVALIFSLAGAWAYAQVGRLDWVVAYLGGTRTFVEPQELSFGTARAGSVLHLSVTFANRAGRPVRLLGSRPDCSCVTTDNFPLTVAAGEDRRLAIDVGIAPEDVGAFEKRVAFWTDSPERQQFVVSITGQVVR